jgi:hypothetical protein
VWRVKARLRQAWLEGINTAVIVTRADRCRSATFNGTKTYEVFRRHRLLNYYVREA